MALLAKARPDANLHKHLATLQEHPALLNRCKQFYLEKLITGCTFVELAGKHGVDDSTANRYYYAYRNLVIAQGGDGLDLEDIIAYIRNEMTWLYNEKKQAFTTNEKAALSRTLMGWQNMLNELKGFVDRSPKIQINTVTQVVNVVDDCMREALLEMGLSEEKTLEVLRLAGEKIGQKVKDGN